VLLMRPSCTSKTLLVWASLSILPKMSIDKSLDVTYLDRLYSEDLSEEEQEVP
jgi:predicted ATPase with chaperone activity